MTDLQQQHCVPCEGIGEPMTKNESENKLKDIPDWTLADDGKSITRKLSFKNFSRTMSFVNAVAYIAEREMHHPDMQVGYNYCHLTYTTHAIGGLSINDFISAAKVNQLLGE